jgi:hypothetical protein
MQQIANETVFDHTAWVVVRPQQGKFLLYNSRTDEMHLISPTGHAVYALCDGLRTVDDIRNHISGALDEDPAVVSERLNDFLGALEARGLVERSDA